MAKQTAQSGDAALIRNLIIKYKLNAEDAYVHQTKGYKVINRRGFKKIQSREKITMKFVLEYTDGLNNCVIQATGNREGDPHHKIRSTLGECSTRNSLFIYPHSVAQSRAEGRLILELAGLYEMGFITEDEIDEKFQVDQVIADRKKTAQDSVSATLKAIQDAKKK